MVFTKILSSTTIFIIKNKKYNEQLISILEEWFLKDCETLKTGVMDTESSNNKIK